MKTPYHAVYEYVVFGNFEKYLYLKLYCTVCKSSQHLELIPVHNETELCRYVIYTKAKSGISSKAITTGLLTKSLNYKQTIGILENSIKELKSRSTVITANVKSWKQLDTS